jgi:hypothetical protein
VDEAAEAVATLDTGRRASDGELLICASGGANSCSNFPLMAG